MVGRGWERHHDAFIISKDRCDGLCNGAKDPFGRICASNKIEEVNLKVVNMMKRLNKSKTLTKYISCECRCEFDGRKQNLRQTRNNDKCQCECKKTRKHCA